MEDAAGLQLGHQQAASPPMLMHLEAYVPQDACALALPKSANEQSMNGRRYDPTCRTACGAIISVMVWSGVVTLSCGVLVGVLFLRRFLGCCPLGWVVVVVPSPGCHWPWVGVSPARCGLRPLGWLFLRRGRAGAGRVVLFRWGMLRGPTDPVLADTAAGAANTGCTRPGTHTCAGKSNDPESSKTYNGEKWREGGNWMSLLASKILCPTEMWWAMLCPTEMFGLKVRNVKFRTSSCPVPQHAPPTPAEQRRVTLHYRQD